MDSAADPFLIARRRMVERDIAGRGVRDTAVLAAMGSVLRHAFVPPELLDSAYADHPLPIGEGQTISQPYVVALMTEAVAVGRTDRVLELGAGSGYQAAVLAEIGADVFTVEFFATLADAAAARLRRLGYDRVAVRAGDGWGGWPQHAPFDAALVTFAAPELPLDVVAQLRPGGRLCLPLGEAGGVQELMLYVKQPDGALIEKALGAVRFVPARGRGARRGIV